MNTQRFFAALLAAFATVLGAASPSFANDGKILPGSICHAEQAGTTGFAISDKSYWSTTQTHWATCPLIRDTVISTGGLSELEVYGKQAQFVRDSVCDARSMGAAGGGVARYVRKGLPFYGAAAGKISYGKSLNSGYDRGLYTLECKLSARDNSNQSYGAFISQIQMVEKD